MKSSTKIFPHFLPGVVTDPLSSPKQYKKDRRRSYKNATHNTTQLVRIGLRQWQPALIKRPTLFTNRSSILVQSGNYQQKLCRQHVTIPSGQMEQRERNSATAKQLKV